MLIYNFQKEFVGIDEKDLKSLGFKDLAALRAEVHDFADLFVKTPGYIHNFKHVHWIDFITCAESNEESKVIINVNNKNYKAVVQINTTYLVDNPSSKAFTVTLNNLRELSVKESESISGDIVEREAPVAVEAEQIFNTPQSDPQEDFQEETTSSNITLDPYETPIEIDMDQEDELPVEEQVEDNDNLDIEIEDFEAPLDITLEDDSLEEEDLSLETQTQTVDENFDNGYVYDPTVASDELGLPLDLIEEFIQDFIEQAKEFKGDLYSSLDEGDLDNLKILSHKLKGVAANLRIEDALEALTVANTSNDINVIRENLDTLYKIVAKLAGEEIQVEKEIEIEKEIEDEALVLDFKEAEEDLYSDPIEINDAQVPQKIELPELADDTFLAEEDIVLEIEEKEDSSLDLLDIDTLEDDLELEEDLTLELEDEPELSLDVEMPDLENESITPEILEYSKATTAADIGLDIESFEELFGDYIQESTILTESISSALNENDLVKCKNDALKLKGMSDNMRVSAFSTELETLMNSSETQELQSAVTTISSLISQLATKKV